MEDRVYRALKQRLYLINVENNNYKIEGSTGKNYVVKISDKCASCECPDFSIRNLMCKHIMFVIIRVYNNKLSNFSLDQNFLEMCDVNKLYTKLDFENVKTELEVNELENLQCLICFEDIDKKSTKCKTCICICHNSCLNIWLKNKNSCPMCRSLWNNEETVDYMDKFTLK